MDGSPLHLVYYVTGFSCGVQPLCLCPCSFRSVPFPTIVLVFCKGKGKGKGKKGRLRMLTVHFDPGIAFAYRYVEPAGSVYGDALQSLGSLRG